jgi:hypothetical protein
MSRDLYQFTPVIQLTAVGLRTPQVIGHLSRSTSNPDWNVLSNGLAITPPMSTASAAGSAMWTAAWVLASIDGGPPVALTSALAAIRMMVFGARLDA